MQGVTMRHVMLLAASIALFGLSACNKSPPAQSAAQASTPASSTAEPSADNAALEAAIANNERLPGDKDEDARRKPMDVLTFLEIRPGQHVVDYFSAGGYYTELLSRVVGSNGQVI